MSPDRDPFDLLAHLPDAEPDPAIMQATIAQSREAFAQRQRPSRTVAQARPGWFDRLRTWMAPAAIGVVAVVAAIVVAPGVMRQPSAPPAPAGMPADEAPPQLSRAPADETVAEAPAAEPPRRMGMQPPPAPSIAAPEAEQMAIFEGEDIRIGTRLAATGLDLLFPDLSGDQVVDSQPLLPGEEIALLDAFRLPGPDLVAVRFHVDQEQFWRVYRRVEGTYARDAALSELASDAPDAAEARRRLVDRAP